MYQEKQVGGQKAVIHTYTHTKLLLKNIKQNNNDSFASFKWVAVLLNPEINRKL